jgi:hypothetical protein
MGKKTAQPETTEAPTEQPEQTVAGPSVIEAAQAEAIKDLATKVADLEATYGRDLRLCCDGCRERVGRAHAGDERERNARYPEGATP